MGEPVPLVGRQPGTHLHPELRNRVVGEDPLGSGLAGQPDVALLTRIADGLRDLNAREDAGAGWSVALLEETAAQGRSAGSRRARDGRPISHHQGRGE